jgi:hypothetical protein
MIKLEQDDESLYNEYMPGARTLLMSKHIKVDRCWYNPDGYIIAENISGFIYIWKTPHIMTILDVLAYELAEDN